MNTATPIRELPTGQLFRTLGRASAIILFASWAGLVIAEIVQRKFGEPPLDVFFQAAALAVVFAGYAVGWRHELAGGLMAVLGTIAFFIVQVVALTGPTGVSAAVWFALPGVLYLLAWNYDRLHHKYPGNFT